MKIIIFSSNMKHPHQSFCSTCDRRLQIRKITISLPSLFQALFYPFLLMSCLSHSPRCGNECLNVFSFALQLPCNMLLCPLTPNSLDIYPAYPYSRSHFLTPKWWWHLLSVSLPLSLSLFFFFSLHPRHMQCRIHFLEIYM